MNHFNIHIFFDNFLIHVIILDMEDCVELILKWYFENKREYPWRMDKNPYHVWISEIMLQQTRIETVIDYYLRFMRKIPTIEDLSLIPEEELLKLWEGLGYYSRARNLKKAAIIIMNRFGGEFPTNYSDILSLPGIGEYTAGAIASICFQLPEVAVDGNVMRVYCRLLNLDFDIHNPKIKAEISDHLKKILPNDSGNFNQGIMELGEVICIPNGVPKCLDCPLKNHCLAHLNKRENLIPRKREKKEKTFEEYTLFLLKCGDKIAIKKRESGLLKNMYEFPNENGFLTFEEIQKKFNPILSCELAITNTHVFSHKKWFMNSYYIEIENQIPEYIWVAIEDIDSYYAIPTAFMPFLQYLKTK